MLFQDDGVTVATVVVAIPADGAADVVDATSAAPVVASCAFCSLSIERRYIENGIP